MSLSERIVRRFLAVEHPFVCWYRVLTSKEGRNTIVSTVVALKFTPESPVEKRTWAGKPCEFYVYPNGFFEHVKAACSEAARKAKTLVGDLKVSARMDEKFERYATADVEEIRRFDNYINFFWIDVDVPLAKGQKKQVEDTTAKLLALSTEFSHLMALEVKKQ
jgi:hypothetical protein